MWTTSNIAAQWRVMVFSCWLSRQRQMSSPASGTYSSGLALIILSNSEPPPDWYNFKDVEKVPELTFRWCFQRKRECAFFWGVNYPGLLSFLTCSHGCTLCCTSAQLSRFLLDRFLLPLFYFCCISFCSYLRAFFTCCLFYSYSPWAICFKLLTVLCGYFQIFTWLKTSESKRSPHVC